MSVRILTAAGAVIMCVGLFAMAPRPSASTLPSNEMAAAEIDFDALRAEATAALQALEQSRERRVASTTATAF
ncbi:MAG TPA: hypothetical protein VFB29_02130 [Pseudolabrys sp.]|nr:hypothetical protein [Pseudolabrys sp.]